MYFRTLHRATLAQAPERTDYEIGDEVIVETTYDSETFRTSMRIVGPAASKTPLAESFSKTRTSSGSVHLDAAFSSAGFGLATHVRVGDRIDIKKLCRVIDEANYTLRGMGLALKPDYKSDGANEFVVVKIGPDGETL